MTDFIVEFKHSIPQPLCDTIINMFNYEDTKYEGLTLGGVQKDIKNTTDFCIPKQNEKWHKIENFLYKELYSKIKKYTNTINEKLNILSENNYNMNFSIFFDKSIFTDNFMIQKYEKNKGKYVYHNDFALHNCIDKSYRVITFLWYLNNVKEGGETIFWDNYKIKPEKGKLLLFPASWTYPHTGKMPISSDKYIITGWLYFTQ
jgi:hypothetical protein